MKTYNTRFKRRKGTEKGLNMQMYVNCSVILRCNGTFRDA